MRYPPLPVENNHGGDDYSIYPAVVLNDWCGEFKPKCENQK